MQARETIVRISSITTAEAKYTTAGGGNMIKYGIIEAGNLLLKSEVSKAYLSAAKKTVTDKSIPAGYKPVEFAKIPKFNQENQAVFQTQAIDAGDKITVGVEVREVKQDTQIEEPIIKDPVTKKE